MKRLGPVALVSCLVAATALAQDQVAPRTEPSTRPAPSPARRDPEARAALAWAQAARLESRCLEQAASSIERAVADLERASEADREAAQQALAKALAERDACRAPRAVTTQGVKGSVTIGSATITSTPCSDRDPLCTDIPQTSTAALGVAVRSESKAFSDCYWQGLERRPDLTGSVRLEAHNAEEPLAEPGHAYSSDVRLAASTLADLPVERCLVDAAKKIAYPVSTQGQTVGFTLLFRPRS